MWLIVAFWPILVTFCPRCSLAPSTRPEFQLEHSFPLRPYNHDSLLCLHESAGPSPFRVLIDPGLTHALISGEVDSTLSQPSDQKGVAVEPIVDRTCRQSILASRPKTTRALQSRVRRARVRVMCSSPDTSGGHSSRTWVSSTWRLRVRKRSPRDGCPSPYPFR